MAAIALDAWLALAVRNETATPLLNLAAGWRNGCRANGKTVMHMVRARVVLLWSAIRRRLSYANVMSTLAVMIVLGSGTAYATVSIVSRAKLANNSLALGGFPAADYRQDVSGASSSTKVSVSPGKWVTVLAWKFTSHAVRKGPMVFLNQVTLRNPGKASGEADVRLVLNGKPEEGPIGDPVGPVETRTILGLLKCDGMPAGVYSAQLQVLATGTSLIVFTADDVGLRPIVIPPGGRGVR